MTRADPRPPLRIMVLYGTRPELIKMAPVVRELRRSPQRFAPILCTTAQHREMLDQMQEVFGLRPDFDLNLMREDQGLNDLSAKAFSELDRVLEEVAPDLLLVQGDTTTAMAGALAAFHRRVLVGHVEAGLRTGDLARPFPEEANRRIIDLVSHLHFAPTERAGRLLAAEGIPDGQDLRHRAAERIGAFLVRWASERP
ncbi:MAG TPA: UDP-N-acetylglucosamine 2-epimerase [Thermoanaerobaculia bacterium]|nr:UDP-N-acetylglucosamine 2-epimerase [Thermoanaerobaculia bacterium]